MSIEQKYISKSQLEDLRYYNKSEKVAEIFENNSQYDQRFVALEHIKGEGVDVIVLTYDDQHDPQSYLLSAMPDDPEDYVRDVAWNICDETGGRLSAYDWGLQSLADDQVKMNYSKNVIVVVEEEYAGSQGVWFDRSYLKDEDDKILVFGNARKAKKYIKEMIGTSNGYHLSPNEQGAPSYYILAK